MKKNSFNYIHFPFAEFTKERFQNEILKNFKLKTSYSLLLKISSYSNLIFKMCGPQIGLVIKDEHDLNFYSKLYDVIRIRIETTLDNYDYIEEIEGLEIIYTVINPQEELKLKNISNISLNKNIINIKKTKKYEKMQRVKPTLFLCW